MQQIYLGKKLDFRIQVNYFVSFSECRFSKFVLPKLQRLFEKYRIKSFLGYGGDASLKDYSKCYNTTTYNGTTINKVSRTCMIHRIRYIESLQHLR